MCACWICCAGGQSLAAAPSAPLLAHSIDGLNLSMNWTSPGATGYYLHYAPIPYTDATSIVAIDMGVRVSFDLTLWQGAAFYVAVSAYNDQGSSGYSNIGQVVINTTGVPAAPALTMTTSQNHVALVTSIGATPFVTGPLPLDGSQTIHGSGVVPLPVAPLGVYRDSNVGFQYVLKPVPLAPL